MYNQINVTISPKALYHSVYFGAPMLAPRSIVSKIENQVKRRNDHHKDADADAQRSARV